MASTCAGASGNDFSLFIYSCPTRAQGFGRADGNVYAHINWYQKGQIYELDLNILGGAKINKFATREH